MANQIIFGFSLFFALLLHAIIIINLPANDPLMKPGAVDRGIGGLKIGFIGSMGSTLPDVTNVRPKELPEPEEIKKTPPTIKPLVKKTIPPKVPVKPVPKSPKKSQVLTQKNKKAKKNKTKKIKTSQTSSPDIGIEKQKKSNSTGQGAKKIHSPVHGSGHSSTGGGKKGVIQNYHDIIRAWLEKHKRYPRMAKRRKQQGTATLYFKIDRKGKVLKHTISHSSGYNALDREVSAMLLRAAPLPPAPDKIPEQALEFNLPVAFNITHEIQKPLC